MKIDRRSFLSFIIGGAAGTALSPLPWKLMDDSSIWTQNWPWTPVPPHGATNYVNSACTLCAGGCGISVRKVDDRAVKIEGIKGHPVNDGGVCPLGISGLQLLYGPRRIKTPLKRAGKRGEGKWKEISWDKAITEVAKKLKELRAKGQSHTAASISGPNRTSVHFLLKRLLYAYGSLNCMYTPSIQDTYELAFKIMHGANAMPGFDFENADFILSFGSGLIEGWGSPVSMFKAHSTWKNNNVEVIQIEPRLSNTAAKSDKWIPVNPGTETALSLAIASEIINNNLYDNYFINNHCSGFDEFKNLVTNEFKPDKVAKITGVEKSVITSLSKKFAGASKPIAVCGRGQGKTPGSLDEFLAVHSLNALAGNINKKGGVRAVSRPDYLNWPDPAIDSAAAGGIKKGRIDGAQSSRYPLAESLLNRLPDAINSSNEPSINLLFVSSANPLYAMPDSNAFRKAFNKIGFIVSFSSYMDETSQNADLILPNHVYLERYEDVPSFFGLQKNVISLAKPVINPMFNTKNTGDVIIEIAKKMGGTIAESFKWDSYQTCLEETFGDEWDTLDEKSWIETEPPMQEFQTDSGKFEFANSKIALLKNQVSAKPEADEQSYPLMLIPYDSMRLANGFIGDPPFVIKTVEDTVLKGKDSLVEVNPKTAASYRLKRGDYAVIKTPKGSAKVKVNISDGIMPGIIALPRGLGHTAASKYIAGKGVNINELIGPVEDPLSGLDAAYGIRASLTRA